MLKNINDLIFNINDSELDTLFSKTNPSFVCNSDIKETRIDYNCLIFL